MFREREDLFLLLSLFCICFFFVVFVLFCVFFLVLGEAGIGAREETEFGTVRELRKMQRPWELLLLIGISFGYI